MNMETDTVNWQKTREETPGVGRVLHFNNAGASLVARPVLERYQRHLILESEIGAYEAADIVSEEENQTYRRLAELINCREDEIALVESASRAWSMAFYSIPFQTGDRILTCENEYASNYIAYLQLARRYGLKLEIVPADEMGLISVETLRSMMDERVKLVSVTHVPTNGGLINPVEEIGRVLAGSDCFYLVDACQSLGQLEIDVSKIACDFLSATGRKYLRGPRGTGVLYVSHRALGSIEPPMLDLHSATWTASDRMHIRPDGKCFEMWEHNVAARLALSEAVNYALTLGLARIEARVRFLADYLRQSLNEIKSVRLLDLGTDRSGIVTFQHEGYDPQEIVQKLHTVRINTSVSPARHTLLDMNRRGLDALVRASVHYYNNAEELDQLINELQKM